MAAVDVTALWIKRFVRITLPVLVRVIIAALNKEAREPANWAGVLARAVTTGRESIHKEEIHEPGEVSPDPSDEQSRFTNVTFGPGVTERNAGPQPTPSAHKASHQSSIPLPLVPKSGP